MSPWLQEEKRRERALLEKQLEDDQRLQAQLAAKAAADKKHLIEFVAKDQVKTITTLNVIFMYISTSTLISYSEIVDFPHKWSVKLTVEDGSQQCCYFQNIEFNRGPMFCPFCRIGLMENWQQYRIRKNKSEGY